MCGAVRSGSILRKKRPAKRTFAPPGRKKTGRKPVTFLQRDCFRRPACGILRARAYKTASMRRCGFVSFCRRNPYPARGRKPPAAGPPCRWCGTQSLPRKGTETAGFIVRRPSAADAIPTPQGDGNFEVRSNVFDNLDAIPTPQGDGNYAAARATFRFLRDAIPTPQGDGNFPRNRSVVRYSTPDAIPTPQGDGNRYTVSTMRYPLTTRSLPRKGTETNPARGHRTRTGRDPLHRHGVTIPGPGGPPIVPYPRKRLASSATGGASPLSPRGDGNSHCHMPLSYLLRRDPYPARGRKLSALEYCVDC